MSHGVDGKGRSVGLNSDSIGERESDNYVVGDLRYSGLVAWCRGQRTTSHSKATPNPCVIDTSVPRKSQFNTAAAAGKQSSPSVASDAGV